VAHLERWAKNVLSEADAYDVAWAFAEKSAGRPYPLRKGPVKGRLESGDTGKKILGCEHSFWSFVFKMDMPSGVIFSPSSVIVLVDPETGRADYFPGL
jgi:hypothetical protein